MTVRRTIHLELDDRDAELLAALCRLEECQAPRVLRRALRHYAANGTWTTAQGQERDELLMSACRQANIKKGGR